MDRSQKEKLVTELHEKLLEAQLVVRVGYSGLKVEGINSLRRTMEKVPGTSFAVLKNTLVEIASRGTSTEPLFKDIHGPNGFLIASKDVIAPAKILAEFSKKNEKLVIKDGVLTGKKISAAQVKSLAEMPGRPELLGMLLYVLKAPAQNFVQVLSAVPRSLLYALNAVKDQKEKAAA